jgi:hemerythrin-like metal-binding protein
MNTQLVWSDEYNIGVDIIDKEHKRLFKIINKLFAFGDEKKKSQWACQEGIKYFKEHAMKHFSDEENYMVSINYEGLKTHRQLHENFRNKTLPALEQELEQTDYAPESVDHFLGVCAGWLIGHTLTEDRAIIGDGISKWINLLPEEEHEAMKKVILQLLYDMFKLESHVVSETYSGEKFGKGVYYRLLYNVGGDDSEEEKECEIILVFEEKLLVNTVGKALGLQTNKLDSMLINATRYTARQFVERVRELLPDMELLGLKEENLLTYEEFRNIFERESLQASLLFDTGEGYFSYCVAAPHLLHKGVGTAIETGNALDEIEKYLMKREEPQKPKILIVDDSMTIRQGMKELLCNDYEIALAKSGMSALQSISLDKPDLILLDYEMPVCDGRQVLQMIRSEESFANLPVIFLTGRTDPESVKKVISLKPEGYLSKYLKHDEIKSKIDKFFERKSVETD